jgi:hypothetical protein
VNVRKVDTWRVWDDYSLINNSEPHHSLEDVQLAIAEYLDGKYVDVHVSVFTPWSFFEFMHLIEIEYGMYFTLVNFLTTQDHDLEFYITLKKSLKKTEDWEKLAKSSLRDAKWPGKVKI